MERGKVEARSGTVLGRVFRGGRFRRMGAVAMGLLLFSGAVLLAKVMVSGSFAGDTINYKVTGVTQNANFTVVLTHVETGSGDQYAEQSNGEGKIEGSGTTGDHVETGDHVTIQVLDENNKEIGSTTIQKGKKNAPWWAYTGLGTAVYLLQRLFH